MRWRQKFSKPRQANFLRNVVRTYKEDYIDSLFKLAFVNGKDGDAKVITFNLNRPVVDENGETHTVTCQVQAPLLALVPLPSFTMDKATVRFPMEVKTQEVSKAGTDAETTATGGYSGWGSMPTSAERWPATRKMPAAPASRLSTTLCPGGAAAAGGGHGQAQLYFRLSHRAYHHRRER